MQKLFTISVLLSCVSACFAQNPIHWWKLDEQSGNLALDSGTLANSNGILSSGVVRATAGPAGGYVTLSKAANSFIDMGTDPSLAFTSGSFTISFWQRLLPSDQSYNITVARHTAGYKNGYIFASNMTGSYGALDREFFYTCNNPQGEAQSTVAVNDGAWHHIVGVYDVGFETRMFVDGVFSGQGIPGTMVSDPASHFAIGAVNTGGTLSGAADAWIDDVQVYDYALSAQQAADLHDHPGSPVPEPATLGALSLGALGLLRTKRRASTCSSVEDSKPSGA